MEREFYRLSEKEIGEKWEAEDMRRVFSPSFRVFD